MPLRRSRGQPPSPARAGRRRSPAASTRWRIATTPAVGEQIGGGLSWSDPYRSEQAIHAGGGFPHAGVRETNRVFGTSTQRLRGVGQIQQDVVIAVRKRYDNTDGARLVGHPP